MIKKPITYTNFDGVTVTGNFYFNFTKAEIISILAKDGNVVERFQNAVSEDNPASFIEPFEWIVSKSYGVRKDDMFIKTEESEKAFLTSEPYSELFSELLTDASKAIEFFNGVFPKALIDQAQIDLNIKPSETVELPDMDPKTNPKKTVEDYSHKELVEMPSDQFFDLVGSDSRKWSKPILAVAMQRATSNQ